MSIFNSIIEDAQKVHRTHAGNTEPIAPTRRDESNHQSDSAPMHLRDRRSGCLPPKQQQPVVSVSRTDPLPNLHHILQRRAPALSHSANAPATNTSHARQAHSPALEQRQATLPSASHAISLSHAAVPPALAPSRIRDSQAVDYFVQRM
ncbi:hypothetical protein PSPO01_06894 [Paraphaeosphaeria sporulosa]